MASPRTRRLVPALIGWTIALGVGALAAKILWDHMTTAAGDREIEWEYKLARWLALGAVLVGWAAFHLRRQRSASFAFSRVDDLASTRPSFVDTFVGLPGALRMIAVAAIAIALGRPQTFRELRVEKDTIDIMIVFDMSKSMEEDDLQLNRMDAAQRVVRRFIKKIRNDRVGLVVFAQRTMVMCPMTMDMKVLDNIVASMRIGDIPEYGTAIGDGLGMALSHLKKRERCLDPRDCAEGLVCDSKTHRCKPSDPNAREVLKSKIVILLSDGDSNVAEHFSPDEAAALAKDMHVKVFTILIGAADAGMLGGMGVNPETMRNIAAVTGGEYFSANDQENFEASFAKVRDTLEKTKQVEVKQVPDKQLYWPWLALAAAALAIELALALTRFRRFP